MLDILSDLTGIDIEGLWHIVIALFLTALVIIAIVHLKEERDK